WLFLLKKKTAKELGRGLESSRVLSEPRAGGGRCQYELPACVAVLMGELLSDPAAPRDPGDIDLPMSELGDDASRKPRERRRPVRKGRKRRAADARHIKRDGRRIERMKKRFGELPIRANTIEQQQ